MPAYQERTRIPAPERSHSSVIVNKHLEVIISSGIINPFHHFFLILRIIVSFGFEVFCLNHA